MSVSNTGSQGQPGIVPIPGISMMSNHRYLDVMTTRPSQGALQMSANSLSGGYQASSQMSPSLGNRHSKGASQMIGGSIQTMPSTHLNTQAHNLPVTGASNNKTSNHTSLLIEPILLPNLQHVHVDTMQDLEESCLFIQMVIKIGIFAEKLKAAL